MQHSSLLKILQALTPAELKRLRRFLQCNYLNSPKRCEKLFSILIQYYPEFTSPKLNSEKLYNRIYPKNSKYVDNASNFRTLVGHLKKGVNQFLILEELNQNNSQKQLLLLDAYIKRGIKAEVQKEVITKFLEQETAISSWYFYDRFKLYWKLYSQELSDTYNRKSESFILLNKYFDHFFALTKIKVGIEQHNLTKREVVTPPIHLIPAVQAFLAENPESIPRVISLYAMLFELSQQPKNGVRRFKEILNLFETLIPQLSREDTKDIAAILFNFTNSKIKNQIFPDTYKRLRFKVVKLGVTYQLYTEDQKMSNMQYKAIVLSSIVVAEFDWVSNFMEHHEKYLAPNSKILCISECKGIFYYFKAKKFKASNYYLKCIDSFNVPKERNVPFSKQKIWYTFIANYEYFLLNKSEKIFEKTQNLHTAIKRNKGFSEEEKGQLKNTLNAVKYMAKTRLNPNSSISAVKKRINDYRQKDHYRNPWIIEMLKEFEQSI